MKVLILGADGYIGWPLSLHLRRRGHEVMGVDNFSRRSIVDEIGNSLTDISSPDARFSKTLTKGYSITSYKAIEYHLMDFSPDCVVHLAEQPSAAYSMRGIEEATYTQVNNLRGTLNLLWALKELHMTNCHVVKLGTMGEYGTPNTHIPEGFIQSGDLKGLPFPKDPGSLYHCSKVHDTTNIFFASKCWGITCTDIMQGVVYGVNYWDSPEDITRFDYDECFGTVINRFLVETLLKVPLTVYGSGDQIRGFLPLQDSLQCLTLTIENPPKEGEYRVFNQLEELYSINELADLFSDIFEIDRCYIEDPRTEAQEHYYSVSHQKLLDLGYDPTDDIAHVLLQTHRAISPFKERIIPSVIQPKIKWR